ncbi:MAG: extracellular solute-binding protein [Alphaproteobacteria bacterium]
MHGRPALPPDFTHLPYANPDAPVGGTMARADIATFDSLNPFIILGRPMWHLRFPRRVFESLMIRSQDEPFTLYGLLAETVEVPEDRSWIAFTLNPKARFADGAPVTVEDVLFSFEALKTQGRPFYRYRHGQVARIDRLGARSVRFVFDESVQDRELPLLIAAMPVFPRHDYDDRAFEKTTLRPPLGSGPYRVSEVQAGRRVVFERRADYWGRDLAINRGFNNFDRLIYDYYRDANTAFEAFKAGQIQIWREQDANGLRWTRGYDFPARRQGRVIRAELTPASQRGMFGLAINTRRPPFDRIALREALVLAFDFPWINDTYFFGAFERCRSFFPGTDLAARGPMSPAERALLAPFPNAVRADLMATGLVFDGLDTDYFARTRRRLTRALGLLEDAGYVLEDGRLVSRETGRPLSLEIMIEHPDQQRVMLAYAAELEKLGIDATVRLVDSSQFQTRSRRYDFDLMPFRWTASHSPGNEQRFRWSSDAGANPGSYNFPGVRSQAVDMLIDALVKAQDRTELRAAARALDRVLLSGSYVVPLYELPVDRVAWWDTVRLPTDARGQRLIPLRGAGFESFDSWWAADGP